MKFAAIILAFFITALSVLPCDICAEASEIDGCQKEIKHVDDCSLCCSPFHACGTCAGFILPLSINISIATELVSHQALDSYQVTQISFHLGAVWQPPKIA